MEAIATIESALRESQNKGSSVSSISAVALYHVLRNPDAAAESFTQLTWRYSPFFHNKNQLSENFRYAEENGQLSGVIGFLSGLGVGIYSSWGMTGLPAVLTLAATGFVVGHSVHLGLNFFPYEVFTIPYEHVRQRLKTRALKRSLDQMLTDETDTTRLQLFEYRFKKWQQAILENRKGGNNFQSVSKDISDTGLLLTFDFPLLTLPFKMSESDYKKLPVKRYIQLVDKFTDIMRARQVYLKDALEVLKESYQSIRKMDDLNAIPGTQQKMLLFIEGWMHTVASSEMIMLDTLQGAQQQGRRLQELVETLQTVDQNIETKMMGAFLER